MEPLKEMFNEKWFALLASLVKGEDKGFEHREFVREASGLLPALSLNQRMRMGSELLEKYLSGTYKTKIQLFKDIIPSMPRGYTNLIFPDYVGLYGHGEVDLSLEALKFFTRFGSSEFAIREFLKRDYNSVIKVMQEWADNKDAHVRRLASEGSRPRLPWSFKLDKAIINPGLAEPILNKLRSDSELYVRKSVANHLNDISKDNPDYMLDLVRTWDHGNKQTGWIIKHASRSLIKKGHPGALLVFNFDTLPKLSVHDFKVSKKVRLGEHLQFGFSLVSEKKSSQKLVVDYVIHYRKSSGALSPKVFKLCEATLEPGQTIRMVKKQIIRDFTTRKHYPGKHMIEIQVNGKKLATGYFNLLF